MRRFAAMPRSASGEDDPTSDCARGKAGRYPVPEERRRDRGTGEGQEIEYDVIYRSDERSIDHVGRGDDESARKGDG
jgi:hypothetical protein